MLRVWRAPAEQYREIVAADGPFLYAAEFRAPGRDIADRLDLMGINRQRVLADLKRALKSYHPWDKADMLSPQDWIDRLAATPGTLEVNSVPHADARKAWMAIGSA